MRRDGSSVDPLPEHVEIGLLQLGDPSLSHSQWTQVTALGWGNMFAFLQFPSFHDHCWFFAGLAETSPIGGSDFLVY